MLPNAVLIVVVQIPMMLHLVLLGKEKVAALGVALDAALLEAGVDALCDVGRNVLAEALNVLAVKRSDAAQSGADHSRVEAEEGLGNLLNAGVRIIEASYKDGLVAVRVELLVNGALREDGHLVERESVGDRGEAVLDHKVGDKATLDDNVELGGPVVDVSRIHAARSEEAHSHSAAVSDKSRESASSSGDCEATVAL